MEGILNDIPPKAKGGPRGVGIIGTGNYGFMLCLLERASPV